MDEHHSFKLAKSQAEPVHVNVELERVKTFQYTDDDRLISTTPRNFI